jgi:hypothetical protein
MRIQNMCALVVAVAGVCGSVDAARAAFIGLGPLPNSSAFTPSCLLSSDGSTVVTSYSQRGYRWRSATGWVDLGDSGGGITVGGVSGDGNVVVGSAIATRSGVTGNYPTVWRDGAWSFLPRSGSDLFGRGTVTGSSADGSRLAARVDGVSFFGRSWEWNGSDYEISGSFSLVNDDTHVEDMSGDGTVIVGWGQPPVGGDRASINPPGGAAGRINMPDGTTGGVSNEDLRAMAISADSRIITGSYRLDDVSPWQVWRRIDGGPTTLLGPGAGVDVSLSGIVAAGDFIYDSEGVAHSVASFLTAGGADLTYWSQMVVTGVSDDGLTFSGTGLFNDPNNEYVQAWIATVPTPGVASVGLVVVAFAARRRRRF